MALVVFLYRKKALRPSTSGPVPLDDPTRKEAAIAPLNDGNDIAAEWGRRTLGHRVAIDGQPRSDDYRLRAINECRWSNQSK